MLIQLISGVARINQGGERAKNIFFTRAHLRGDQARAYLRGGFRGFKPPSKFSEFFLKSEGKEIERKRKKRGVGGGGTS